MAEPDPTPTPTPEPEPSGGVWPENWRTEMAGGDEKMAKHLERMKSPNDVFTSWRSLGSELTELKGNRPPQAPDALPEGASEEDKAAHDQKLTEFRKAAGLPDKPDGYLDNLPGGIVVGEEDKPIVDGFLQAMHAKNRSPEVVHEALQWYYSEVDARRDALAQEDAEASKATEDALRSEWGGEYRMNMNSIEAFLEAAPDGLGEALKGARLATGEPLMASESAVKWLATMADAANPAGTMVPGSGMQNTQALSERKAEIEGIMRTNRGAYNKDEAMQKEYREIIEAEDRLKGRAA